jgi:hypothetical protein
MLPQLPDRESELQRAIKYVIDDSNSWDIPTVVAKKVFMGEHTSAIA